MFRNLSIRTKLFLMAAAVSIPAVMVVGGLANVVGQSIIEEAKFDQLTSVRSVKATQVEAYFRQIRNQVKSSSEDLMVVDAMREMADAFEPYHKELLTEDQWASIRTYYAENYVPQLQINQKDVIEIDPLLPEDAAAARLQMLYIIDNPHPVGDKDELDRAADGSEYTSLHGIYHPIFREFVDDFGYYDLFLIDTSGHIVYSVFKEVDFGTSLIDGPYRDSNLAEVFRRAIDDPSTDAVKLEDFAHYNPSYGAPASFIASPIDAGGERLGVLAFQMPVGEIDHIMTGDRNWGASGLGTSGETYLVGPDFKMRSTSRFIIEDPESYLNTLRELGMPKTVIQKMQAFGTSILFQEVRSEAVRQALAGKPDTSIIDDYRGVPVLSSFAPLDIEDVEWAILAEIDAEEAFAPTSGFTRILLIGFVGTVLLVLLLSSVFSRVFVAPILDLEDGARRFSMGESDVEIPVNSSDELGRLTDSFNQMVISIHAQNASLEESETRMRAILDSAADGIITISERGEISSFNAAAEQIFGYSGEEVGGRNVSCLMPDPHSNNHDEYLKRYLETGDATIIGSGREVEGLRKDGTLFPMHLSVSEVDVDGRKLFTGIVRDITARKMAEEELRKYREGLEHLVEERTVDLKRASEELENISSVILRWDSAGKIVFMNDFGLRLFGFSREELVGQPLLGTIIPAEETTGRNLEMMVSEIITDPEKYESNENENMRKDGGRIWVAWRNQPILNDDGSLRQILTIGIDITLRKRVEEQVNQQKELLENTLESLTHPFYVIDANDYTIEIANSAARRLGIGTETKCHVLTHKSETPCDSADDPCPLVKVKETKKPVVLEHVHVDADGNRYFSEVHGYPVFDDEGEVVQMIEYSLDITDRKKMQLELEKATTKAEEANRAKSSFLANMSHELRTPMNAIIGYSEMLAEDAEDEGLDEMVPDLQKINSAGKHLLGLINDILDLSKIEAGRMDLYLERFELEGMLEDAVSTINPLITKNNNQIITEFGEGLGAMRADLTKVRQALFNLLSNAAKFTSEGVITLKALREIRDGGAEWILISVSDNGIGIPPDKIDHVFEEFSQADDSTTREYGGTGLGLPISRRFCRMMGGDITAASVPGSGSTFTIELPATVNAMEAAKSSAEPETSEAAPTPVGAHPILVIDDDLDARDLMRRTLENEGYTVVTAADGPTGLEMARKYNPSLITLDVMMPGMDGWAVLKELKADSRLRHIPVMMATMVSDRDMGFSLGAVEYLTKPVERDKLRELVHHYAEPGGGGHALVVDDDDNIRSLFRRALEADGWHVAEAKDGAQALVRVGEQKPDVVLLDLMMPVMDGFDFVVAFRAEEQYRSTPIIVLSAKDLTEEDHRRLNGGVERIVQKGGISLKEILDQVRSLVSIGGSERSNSNGEGDSEDGN